MRRMESVIAIMLAALFFYQYVEQGLLQRLLIGIGFGLLAVSLFYSAIPINTARVKITFQQLFVDEKRPWLRMLSGVGLLLIVVGFVLEIYLVYLH